MERRFTTQHKVGIEERDGHPPAIVGYGAVFYRADDPGTEYQMWEDLFERIKPGAFDRALKEADDTRALFNHNPDNLLGRSTSGTLKLTIDAVGLRYEITPPDSELGRSVVASVKRGDLSGSSFAFMPDKQTWEEKRLSDKRVITIRNIESVRLYDVGPVTYPAYEATTTGIRSAGCAELTNAFNEWKAEQVRVRMRLLALDNPA